MAEPLHEQLRDKVRNADIIYGDETSWRIDGQSAQLWYAGTPDFSFFHIDPSRSGEVAASIFGSPFQGALVADDYAGYNAIHPQHRQSCLAHLSRKAKEILQLIALLPPLRQPAPAIDFCKKIRALFSCACELSRMRDTGRLSFREAQAHIPRLLRTTQDPLRKAACAYGSGEVSSTTPRSKTRLSATLHLSSN